MALTLLILLPKEKIHAKSTYNLGYSWLAAQIEKSFRMPDEFGISCSIGWSVSVQHRVASVTTSCT